MTDLCSRLDTVTLKALGRKDSQVAQKDLRRVRTAARRIERAERELAAAILQAVEAGETYRDIAPWAGLSYSRVYQLAEKARAERE